MKRKLILFFDSCAFYPPLEVEKIAILKIKELEKAGYLRIDIAYAGDMELMRGPRVLVSETVGRLFTIKLALNSGEEELRNKLQVILFGDKQINKGQENDVTHLFEALKYGCDYFVTFDCKHILSKAEPLRREVGIRVVSPSECLRLILRDNPEFV